MSDAALTLATSLAGSAPMMLGIRMEQGCEHCGHPLHVLLRRTPGGPLESAVSHDRYPQPGLQWRTIRDMT